MQIATETSIPEERHFDGKIFPLTFSPSPVSGTNASDIKEQFKAWLTSNGQNGNDGNKGKIEKLLIEHGAILFRGFHTNSAQDFADCVLAIGYENFPYKGGNAVRKKIVGDIVFTANEAAGPIPFHHEMAQVPIFPKKLYFYCQKPAHTGGETPLVLSHYIYKKLREKFPEYIEKLEKMGVIYNRIMTAHDRPESPLGRGWKSTFGVSTKSEAEEKLRSQNYSWEWMDSDVLHEITPILPAVRVDERTGQKVFFNQMIAAYTGWKDQYNNPEKAITLGDKTPLDTEFMRNLIEISQNSKMAFLWKSGDILLVDNITTMHSRHPYTGGREILASLAQ